MTSTRMPATDQPSDPTPGGSGRSGGRRIVLPAGVRRILTPVLALVLVQALATLMFSWPAGGAAMHRVPMAVAGPDVIAATAARSLEGNPKGAISVTRVPDPAAARRAVLDRRVYAALVIEDDGLRLLIASAASPTVALQITQAVQSIQARAQGTYLEVEDLAPQPRRDPRGQAPAAALLALLITSVGAGVLVLLRFGSTRDRVVALLALALLGGAASAVVLHVVLGVLTGSMVAETGTLALLVLATAAVTTGLGVLADLPGTALAAMLTVAVGYPISGASSAPEYVPGPWQQIGRLLPPGAGITSVRDVAFFGGAGATGALLTLTGWAVVGLAVVAVADLITPSRRTG